MENKNYYNVDETVSPNEKRTIIIVAVILGILALTTLYYSVRG